MYYARGLCTVCNRFEEAYGADEYDATILFNHYHGVSYQHTFTGEVRITKEVKDERGETAKKTKVYKPSSHFRQK